MPSVDDSLTAVLDDATALNNRGNALREFNRPEEALASYEHALALDSNYGKVCKAIGKRLFKNKSEETIEEEKARLAEWRESCEKKGDHNDEDDDG